MARRRATPEQQAPLPFGEQDPWLSPNLREVAADHARKDGDPELAARIDDYVNRLTGLGDYLQDKVLGGSMYGLDFTMRYISGYDAESRWRGSDLGARIVETIPAEMTREGWEVLIQPSEKKGKTEPEGDDPESAALDPTQEDKPSSGVVLPDLKGDAFPNQGGDPAAQGGVPPFGAGAQPKPSAGPLPEIDDEGTEISEALGVKMDELNTIDAVLLALQYQRAYGGGAILIGADDGVQDLAEPLDEENIKAINWLNTFQGGREGEIIAWSYYRDPRAPKYGEPELYMVRNIGVPLEQPGNPRGGVSAPGRTAVAEAVFWVHESRLIIFPGTPVSRRARVQMRGWGDSVFTRVDEVLAQYSQTWSGIANLMTDFKLDVLKMSGMSEKMAGGDKASKGNPITKRARLMQQTRSIARMQVIDATEEFDRKVVSVAGVSEVLQQFALRLAAAADMPVTLLMGQAPSGLNATGSSDIRFFYDRIASWQRRVLIPRLKRLVRLIFLSKEGPTQGNEPERWDIRCKSLYQLSEKEQAELRKLDSETDHNRITDGVLSPEEVAASAYGGSEYSSERTIDFDGREQMAAQEAADKQAKLEAQQKIMSESAKAGLSPGQLALNHPEHPNNTTPPEPDKPPPFEKK